MKHLKTGRLERLALLLIVVVLSGCVGSPEPAVEEAPIQRSAEPVAPVVVPSPTVTDTPAEVESVQQGPSRVEADAGCAAYADFLGIEVADISSFPDGALVSAVSVTPGGGTVICAFMGADPYAYGGNSYYTIAFWLPAGFPTPTGVAWIRSVMQSAGYELATSGGVDTWTKGEGDGNVRFSGDATRVATGQEAPWWRSGVWVVNIVEGDVDRY